MAAHQIAACLGPEKSRALPMFHALTGCDTSSAFVGHGKKTAWVAWNSLPELTDALLRLVCAPAGIPEHSMQAIERFVILMYDRTSTCTDVNKARKKLFVKRSSVQRTPHQHVLLWNSMSRGLSSRVVMSGVKHLSHSLCFLLQVAGGGSRLMMDYMNHIGPHFRKHPRRATS